MNKPFEININNKEILNEFTSFISPDDNIDIIISAPFGTGKTHFLQKDFYESTKEDFNVFHLFPVNYSVSSNEDILELIKFDLLQECLIKHHNVIEDDESLGFSSALRLSFFLNEKFNIIDFTNGVVEKVSNLIPTDEMDVVNHSLTLINFLYKEWNKIKTKSKVKNEQTIFDDYFKSFSKNKGIYENDDFTKFIKSFLLKLKTININKNKKNILIIDDFDRIDPEHIFRLFNVFSAQKNYTTKVDKFGFDKVIFVCDINNIRKIYHHKYGVDVDFWGYISKFVSYNVFHFDNKDLVGRHLYNFLDNVSYNRNLDYEVILSDTSTVSNESKRLVIYLLKMLIYFDCLSLREIVKVSSLNVSSEKSNKKTNFQIICMYIDTILGSKDKFKTILNELHKKNQVYNYKNININQIAIINEYVTLFSLLFKKSQTGNNVEEKRLLYDNFEITITYNYNKISGINFIKGSARKFNIIEFLLQHI